MGGSSEVLDRRRVREVAGVFHSLQRLNDAIQALLMAGFDRADIDVIAELDAVGRRGLNAGPRHIWKRDGQVLP